MSTHTPEQVEFLNAVLFGRDHLILPSTAGSGKTSTLIEAASVLPSPASTVYFTYNRRQERVADRLPQGLRASSVHAYGYRVLRVEAARSGRDTRVNVRRTDDLIRRLKYPWVQSHEIHTALAAAWDAWREDRLSSAEDLSDIERLCGWADLRPRHAGGSRWSSQLGTAMRDLHDVSLTDWQLTGTCDFPDMLWLILELGLQAGSLTAAIVDEAQDFTALRTDLIDHLTGLSAGTGRLIAAGDPSQMIYSYGMIRPGTLWQLAENLGARVMPLSVSFRLPQAVGALCVALGAGLRCHEGNPVGAVICAPCGPQALGPVPTTILARTTARLLEFAALTRQSGRAANLADAQLARALATAVTKTLSGNVLLSEIPERLTHSTLSPGLCRVVAQIAQSHPLPGTEDTPRLNIPALLTTFEALTLPGRSGALIPSAHDTYLTIHAAKGREWNDVTVVWTEDLCGEPLGEHPESCVTFVALSRTQHTLRLLYGDHAWASGKRLGHTTPQYFSASTPPTLSGWTWTTPQITALPLPVMVAAVRSGPPKGWPPIVSTDVGEPIRSGALRLTLEAALSLTRDPLTGAYLRQELRTLPAQHVWVRHDRSALRETQAHIRTQTRESSQRVMSAGAHGRGQAISP